MNRDHLPLAVLLFAAGCTSTPRLAAPPPATRPPLLAPARPIVLPWGEAPVERGNWSYTRDGAGSAARFGAPGNGLLFELRCDLASRQVLMSRPAATGAAAGGTMKITTSYGERSWAANLREGGLVVTLPARDPFLDQLAFSRARFAVEAPGLPRLILPAWAEPTRVIEDCRG